MSLSVSSQSLFGCRCFERQRQNWSFISTSKSFVIWLVWFLQRQQSSVASSKEVRCDLWSSPGGWRYLQEPGQHSQNTRGWTEILTFPNNLPPSTFIHSPAVITPNWHSNWLPNTCRLKLPGSNTCLLGVVQPSASSVELSTNLRKHAMLTKPPV